MIYLDLQKQKRTLEQNEFTIPVDSEEAKAFFTLRQPNQDLVIDLENKTTYFKEYEMQEDGTRYKYYFEDGTPDLEKIMEEDNKNLLQSIESSIQDMIEKEAQSRGYDDIVSACSYAGYPNEFQNEAISLGTWRSAVWAKAYELQSSMTEVPTVEEVLSQLPTYTEAV